MAINFLSKSPRFGASYVQRVTRVEAVKRQNIVVQFLTDEYRFPPGKAQSIQEVMEEQKRQGISHPTKQRWPTTKCCSGPLTGISRQLVTKSGGRCRRGRVNLEL